VLGVCRLCVGCGCGLACMRVVWVCMCAYVVVVLYLVGSFVVLLYIAFACERDCHLSRHRFVPSGRKCAILVSFSLLVQSVCGLFVFYVFRFIFIFL
jgi:hypothetical protein